MATLELVPQEDMGDGVSRVTVPVSVAERWSYFAPLLSGRWDLTKPTVVPLSTAEIEAWLLLDEMMQAPETDKTTMDYSLVSAAAEFFGWVDDSWLERVVVDQDTPHSERKEAYRRQGHWIRSTGVERAYFNSNDKYVLHGNFFIGRDPVYDYTVWSSSYDMDISSPRWDSIITPEQRDRAMALEFLSVLAGIVHTSWLLYNNTVIGTEIPWTFVPWNDVIDFVPNSNALRMLTQRPGQLWSSTRGIGQMSRGNRNAALDMLEQYGREEYHAYYEYALADLVPTTEPQVYAENHQSYSYASSPSGILFSPGPHQGKTLLNLYVNDVLGLYDKMSVAMSQSTYKTKLKGDKTGELDKLRKRLVLSGLSPVLEGGTPQDINKYGKIESLYGYRSNTVVSPESVVPVMTLNALYRSQWFRGNSKIYITKNTIPTEDFPAIVQYFVDTLGTAALERAALMLMEYYAALPDKKKDERLLTFSQAALALLPEGELTGAVSIP